MLMIYKPKLVPKVDLKGAIPELLAKVLFTGKPSPRCTGGGSAVASDEHQVDRKQEPTNKEIR